MNGRTRAAGHGRAASGRLGTSPKQPAPRTRRAVAAHLDITPDKSLIRKLGSTGYRTYEAISELVDNSIDARGGRKVSVRVSIGYADGSIGIDDDGVGMGLAELGNAMTVAKETAHPHGKRLGMFGLGMKTACSFLGRSFSVATSEAGSQTEYIVDYDEDGWEGDETVGWQNFPYRKRKKPDPVTHGTRIRIGKLRVPTYAEQTTVFKKRLGERYAEYIRRGQADIHINSVTCEPVSHRLADGSVREFEVATSAGPVPAWIGMLERRSVVGSYGIDLYYRNRLIRMHSKFGIRSHPDMARIVGRVSLDHVPVNFHKTDFIVESAEYAEAEKAFREHPVVRGAVKAQALARNDGGAAAAAAGVYDYLLGRTDDPAPIALRTGRAASRQLLDAMRPAKFKVHNRAVRIDYAESDGAPYTVDGRGSTVSITVNKKSRLFSAVANPLYLVALAVAEARAACATGGDVGAFLDERSRIWTRTMDGWLPEERPLRARASRSNDASNGYRLSRRLGALGEFLGRRYEFVFEFSGLSTLEEYAHNVLGTPIYSLYTEKGQGAYLRDLVTEHDNTFVPVVGPDGDGMRTLLDANRGRPFVAIREYAKSGLRRGLAAPAKAWMDLLREVRYYHMPVLNEDLAEILLRLKEYGLVGRSDLLAISKRRGRASDPGEFLDEVFN